MTGLPPLRIHVREDATPTAIHKPSTIPAHWVEQVKQDLERDIELGVLERVPSNTPTTWCSRMHVVGKKMGETLYEVQDEFPSTFHQEHANSKQFVSHQPQPSNQGMLFNSTNQGYTNEPTNKLAPPTPYKNQGISNHMQVPPQPVMHDVGPKWHIEHPNMAPASGHWPVQTQLLAGSINEAQGGFPSGLRPGQHRPTSQVHYDVKRKRVSTLWLPEEVTTTSTTLITTFSTYTS